ncbi:Uncharacterised protein [Legionella spiritensis]|nr:Uncharacterised protein [Legionella spiritensis]VEG89750.1 Uncharacterised protein [Legionella spiritensis]
MRFTDPGRQDKILFSRRSNYREFKISIISCHQIILALI